MSDELDRLKAALAAATPAPDPEARKAAIQLAQKNFADRQGLAGGLRPISDRTENRGGFVRGVKDMFHNLGLRPALLATSGLAVVGLGIILVLPMDDLKPPRVHGGLQDGKVETTVKQPAKTKVKPVEADSIDKSMVPANEPPAVVKEAAPAGPTVLNASPSPQAMDAERGIASTAIGQLAKRAGDDTYIRPQDRERFADAGVNPLEITAENPVSTFSIDVDTASYAYVRASIMNGALPRPQAVRVEEMVNYFPYDYPQPQGDMPFSTTVSVFQTPWNSGTKLVHIGIQGEKPAIAGRPPLDLVFLIDTSGSMQDQNKLPLLKQSFRLLLSRLTPEDKIAIVTYAGSSGLVLEPTAASETGEILAALDRLSAGGSTAGQAGLQLAYLEAEKMAAKGRVGRILLATDGDFNVGISDPDALTKYIEQKRDSGTYLSVLGFGRGNYNDALMQAIAQNGNGTAAYIDTLSEAQKVLVDQVSGALFPIADDVKIQVEFNPAMIAEYRLIGYETRALAREDFNNDKVDAGEIGAGHTVTAIYEVTPVGSPAIMSDPLRYQDETKADTTGELGFLKLRYKLPGEKNSHLMTTAITDGDKSSMDARFSAAIAGFGQILQGGRYIGDWSYGDAIALANANKGDDPYGYRAEAVTLMRLAQSLAH